MPVLPPILPTLQDYTSRWGLVHSHEQRRESLTAITETLGAGACVFDYNRDGLMDLLLVGGSGQRRPHGAASWWQSGSSAHRLYQNVAGVTFLDVTKNALPQEPQWGMGCDVADLDDDGDLDLVLSGYNDTRLYENVAGTSFVDRTPGSGLIPVGWYSPT